MSPEDCAQLLIKIAEHDPIYDGAMDEVVYLLAWHLWDLMDEEAPWWTEGLGRALGRLRPGITPAGSRERFQAYSEAKANEEGGGPGWHIARAFQSYTVGGHAPLDVTQTLDVSMRLAAMTKGMRDILSEE